MTRSKIGVSTLFTISRNFKVVANTLPRLGVDYVELLDDGQHALNATRIATLKKLKKDCAIEFTMHAPFADINIASLNRAMLKVAMKQLEKSMIHARQLDGLLWVFHPGSKTGLSFFYPDMEWRVNMESVEALTALARQHGVKIAIENLPVAPLLLMKNVDEVERFFNEFQGDVDFVLDVGHANLNGQVGEFLSRFPKRIVHMHLSDNKGDRDTHLGIGYGTVNWIETVETLKRINYNGLLIVESIEHVEESVQTLRKILA